MLLLIEMADSSRGYDLNTKSGIYADLGVREYWVVEAWPLLTHVHLEPAGGRYARLVEVPLIEPLAPHLLSGLTVRLGEIGVD